MSASSNGTLYFFREYEEPYGYLSQWYADDFLAPSTIPGESNKVFATAEQYMMYRKAMVFNDAESAGKIMKTREPKMQKALGRKVKNFNGKKWDEVKEQAVEDGNYWKFGRSMKRPEMRRLLLDTGDRLLVEASPYDRIWGIGFSAANADERQKEWGQNLLGQAIMRARARLRAEEAMEGNEQGATTAES